MPSKTIPQQTKNPESLTLSGLLSNLESNANYLVPGTGLEPASR